MEKRVEKRKEGEGERRLCTSFVRNIYNFLPPRCNRYISLSQAYLFEIFRAKTLADLTRLYFTFFFFFI